MFQYHFCSHWLCWWTYWWIIQWGLLKKTFFPNEQEWTSHQKPQTQQRAVNLLVYTEINSRQTSSAKFKLVWCTVCWELYTFHCFDSRTLANMAFQSSMSASFVLSAVALHWLRLHSNNTGPIEVKPYWYYSRETDGVCVYNECVGVLEMFPKQS